MMWNQINLNLYMSPSTLSETPRTKKTSMWENFLKISKKCEACVKIIWEKHAMQWLIPANSWSCCKKVSDSWPEQENGSVRDFLTEDRKELQNSVSVRKALWQWMSKTDMNILTFGKENVKMWTKQTCFTLCSNILNYAYSTADAVWYQMRNVRMVMQKMTIWKNITAAYINYPGNAYRNCGNLPKTETCGLHGTDCLCYSLCKKMWTDKIKGKAVPLPHRAL